MANKRVLVISYFYPPANSLPSQRVSKFTKYLYRWGWEPHVLTAGPQKSLLNDMVFEIPDNLIHQTRRCDFDRFLTYTFKHREFNISHDSGRLNSSQRISEFLRDVGQKTIIPDGKIGWYPFAVKRGREIIENINPSVIFAVGGPYTGLMVAAKLSKESGIPWVADILDPWSDNYSIKKFYPLSVWNDHLERKTLSSCSKILIVTEPWAADLRKKYGDSHVEIVCNGYDDEDFLDTKQDMIQEESKIRIVYTGFLYRRQVPEVFFAALRQFLKDQPEAPIIVNFYGPWYPNFFFDYVKKYRLEGSVFYNGQISYRESIVKQKSADLLLLFTWGTRGVLLAKTLSYLGAGRPILSAGPEDDTTADFIKNNHLGLASNQAEKIQEFLEEIYQEKRQHGRIAPLQVDDTLKKFYSYRNQAEKLSSVLEEVAAF
jgi:glycosyltransferase involved in cell wall biosynthesis